MYTFVYMLVEEISIIQELKRRSNSFLILNADYSEYNQYLARKLQDNSIDLELAFTLISDYSL